MKNLFHFSLRVLRTAYGKIFNNTYHSPIKPWNEKNPEVVSEIIYSRLSKGDPCMIARYGATEMAALLNYLSISYPPTFCRGVIDFIKGERSYWWWHVSVQRWV